MRVAPADEMEHETRKIYLDDRPVPPSDLLSRTAGFVLSAPEHFTRREIILGVAELYAPSELYDERLVADALDALEDGRYILPTPESDRFTANRRDIVSDFIAPDGAVTV